MADKHQPQQPQPQDDQQFSEREVRKLIESESPQKYNKPKPPAYYPPSQVQRPGKPPTDK